MSADNENEIARVIGQVNDLTQSLKGYGTSGVTAAAEVDGKKLSDALTALKATIDEFLSKPGPEMGFNTGRGGFDTGGAMT